MERAATVGGADQRPAGLAGGRHERAAKAGGTDQRLAETTGIR